MINAHRSWIRVYIIGKSMKWIPIFVLVLMNCSSGILSNDNFVIYEYDIIGADNIKRCDYFVSDETDTMATSFIFYTNSFGKVNISVLCVEESKRYMYDLCPDTMTIVEKNCFPKHKFRLSSYKELLSEFGLCLKKASKKFDVHQLHYISLQLADLPEIAISLSKLIRDDDISHKSIDNALETTSLISDINKVLKQYGVEVNSISSCEEIIKMESIPYCKRYGITMSDMPSFIWDTTIEIIVDTLSGSGDESQGTDLFLISK